MMPEAVIQTLRKSGKFAESRDCAVIFADVVGFTRITAGMEPKAIVQMVNELFDVFEDLTLQHGAQKIDIIGGAGLPALLIRHAF